LLQLRGTNRAFADGLAATWKSCKAALALFGRQTARAIAALQRLGRVPGDAAGIASFLFDGHGLLPAKSIGNYLTAPSLETDELAHEDVLVAYLQLLDLSEDSPPQALRRLLARTRMPQRTKGAGELFHATARRYVTCQRNRALPTAHCAETMTVPALPLAMPPEYIPRNCYGFDVASLNEDDVFVLIYTIIILNAVSPRKRVGLQSSLLTPNLHPKIPVRALQDLRAPSIKTKMTRMQFVSLNLSVDSLRHVPSHFFEGLYEEVAVRGLPINDKVPISPVLNVDSVLGDRKFVAALRPLVRSVAAVVVERAETALSWLRRVVATAASASGSPPFSLYRAGQEVR
jgi:Sec7-like guanine-nucleotide exchange factor